MGQTVDRRYAPQTGWGVCRERLNPLIRQDVVHGSRPDRVNSYWQSHVNSYWPGYVSLFGQDILF